MIAAAPIDPGQMPTESTSQVDQIDQLLPQTQCTQCDYPRCRDYASAIAAGEAAINQCPPGGQITIKALAALLEKQPLPLNPENGVEEPKLVAWIRESACIGCRLCIKACPVDAIIGAGKVMHTVIAQDCTGCKLCVPVCPTDCIDLLPAAPAEIGSESIWPAFTAGQVAKSRQQTERRIRRIAKREAAKQADRIERQRSTLKREIAAIVARKRHTRNASNDHCK